MNRPQHEALAAAKLAGSSGGGGGTSDYNQLNHKPSINGVTLDGNKTSTDLGLQSALPFDSVPTEGSTNPVESNGVYDALAGKQDTIDNSHKLSADLVDDSTSGHKFAWSGTQAEYAQAAANIAEGELVAFTDDTDIDTTPTQGSDNPVTSDGIYRELAKLKVINENPENHNGIYRGKDLTNVYTIEQMYERVHDGSFEDLYLGDYFTVHITTDLYTRFTGAEFESGTVYYEMGGEDPTTRTWTATEDATPQSGKTYATKQTKTESITLMFAAFDYYYNMGDTSLTTHHAVLIPKTFFATTVKMNPTNTTAGGYYSSDMHQITLPCYAKSLKTALGNHLLAHKTWLTTTVNTSTPSMAGAGMTGAASASAWGTTELQLMNEVQLYGSTVWSSSAYDVGVDNEKLPVFNFINSVRFGRGTFWLRSVVSSTHFAYCYSDGGATYSAASYANGVRPLILFG